MNFNQKILNFSGELFYNEKLSNHTYYKIGGEVDVLAIPKNIDDLIILKKWIKDSNIPYFIFGFGSNLLCKDSGFSGLAIKISKLDSGLKLLNEHSLYCGSSVSVNSFLRFASKEGLSGLEFLSGIPGNIGGSIAMNAGTHLGETSHSLKSYTVFSLSDFDHHLTEVLVNDQTFEYRKNKILKSSEIILNSIWNVKKDSPEKVKQILEETLKRRKETQPLEFPSCGSVFKNPIGTTLKAWEVIEKCSLRGKRIGNAQISEKHPNWIINLGNASSEDVIQLIEFCKSQALSQFNIKLEAEVKIIG